jgi:hypothetical protein
MKIYLAGKIAKNDWRHRLVPDLRLCTDNWERTSSLPMRDDTYVGPFFISCDHGCGHGANSHGATPTCEMKQHDIYGRHYEVFKKSFSGIEACDLFIVWADEDFSTAYGTMTEIGMARAWNKIIVFITKTGVTLGNQWFAKECAGSLRLTADDPVAAIDSLLHVLKALHGLNNELKTSADNLNIQFTANLFNQLEWKEKAENTRQIALSKRRPRLRLVSSEAKQAQQA